MDSLARDQHPGLVAVHRRVVRCTQEQRALEQLGPSRCCASTDAKMEHDGASVILSYESHLCCHRQHGVAGPRHKRVAERGQVGLEVLAGGLDGCQHQSDKLSGTYERSGCRSDTIMALLHSASHTACMHANAKVSTLPCLHAGVPSAVPHSAGHSLHTMTSFRRSHGKSGPERKWRADADNNGS